MFSITALRALALVSTFFLLNCSGGGNDNKPQPPPTPPTFEVSTSAGEGTTWGSPSVTVKDGDTAFFTVSLLPGRSNLQVNALPAASAGTLSPGLVAGTFNYTTAPIHAKTSLSSSSIPTVVPLYTISGKGGASGATATLSPGGITSKTGTDGKYTLTGVANGIYEVSMSLPGFTFTPSSRTVTVSGADVPNVDFTATFASPTVEMIIRHLDHDNTGGQNNLVQGQSLAPLVAGTTFVGSVQKPGESNFTFIGQFVASQDGGYLSLQLHQGVEFFDTLPDGTKKFWSSGVATYKVDITTVAGVKTSVIAKVPVLMGPGLTFGPLQNAVVSVDGKSIQLLGNFPTPPVATLEVPNMGYSVIFADFQGKIAVPPGNSGTMLYLVVSSGYPNAESSTTYVNIP